jgi:hypothetical protein
MPSSFENTIKLHGVLTLLTGAAVYSQYFSDVVTMLGVGGESSHSLRNTGFLLMLVSFLCFSAVWPSVRQIPAFIGKILSGDCEEGEERGHAFAAGVAASANLLLLCHYTIEAFVYHAVSKVFTSLVWVLTLCAVFQIKLSLSAKKEKKGQ